MKSELEQEGFTPDEAARLIQQVFRRVKAGKTKLRVSSLDSVDTVSGEAKSWDEAMVELTKIMQVSNSSYGLGPNSNMFSLFKVVHTNNMDFHCLVKKSKESVELSDIKSVRLFLLQQHIQKVLIHF